MNAAQHTLILVVRVYRAVLSPVLTALGGPLGLGCRFQPTCSQYAVEALRMHGAWCGTRLTLRRLGRCHPWGGCGADPVPSQVGDNSTRAPAGGDAGAPRLGARGRDFVETSPHGS